MVGVELDRMCQRWGYWLVTPRKNLSAYPGGGVIERVGGGVGDGAPRYTAKEVDQVIAERRRLRSEESTICVRVQSE